MIFTVKYKDTRVNNMYLFVLETVAKNNKNYFVQIV